MPIQPRPHQTAHDKNATHTHAYGLQFTTQLWTLFRNEGKTHTNYFTLEIPTVAGIKQFYDIQRTHSPLFATRKNFQLNVLSPTERGATQKNENTFYYTPTAHLSIKKPNCELFNLFS